MISRVICPKQHTSDVEEKFFNLSLPVFNSGSVKNSIKNYFRETEGIRDYFCF